MKISDIKIPLIFLSLFLASCSLSDRPKMAYDTKDRGAVQEINSFDVTASAENFRAEAESFAEKSREIIDNNQDHKTRRTSREKIDDYF